MEGVLLIGKDVWTEELTQMVQQLAENLKQQEITVMEVAFLEGTPDIAAGVLTCVKQGVIHLTVIPCFHEGESMLQEAEQIVRDEVMNFRGMSMSLVVPEVGQITDMELREDI